MDICPGISNTTIANSNETWQSIDRKTLKDLSINSYFRPDVAAALIPWILALILIITHLPTLIIRVVKWENVQIVCLVSTMFTIIVYIQAYVSTKLTADKILLWNPLILVIDAGSMLQLSVLVFEEHMNYDRKNMGGLESNRSSRPGKDTSLLSYLRQSLQNRNHSWMSRNTNGRTEPEEAYPNEKTTQVPPKNSIVLVDDICNISEQQNDQREPAVAEKSNIQEISNIQNKPSCLPRYCALISMLFFLVVVVLQIIGLQAAIKVRKGGKPPEVSWCSPAFQPNGVAVIDGDCHVYEIDQYVYRGVGCVSIPGVWQKTWLNGTIVGTMLSLVCQVVDMAILLGVRGSRKWRGMKMKRPWTTMILGLIMLCVTFLYSYQYASMLPPGITERVTIAVNEGGLMAFDAHLSNAGMRGTVIAWNDGIFESWGDLYNGSFSTLVI